MENSDVDGSLTAEIELDLEPDAFVKLGGVTITSTKLIPSPSVLESCIATPTTRQAGGGDVQQQDDSNLLHVMQCHRPRRQLDVRVNSKAKARV